MTLRIRDFDWVAELVEKNRAKHGVEPEEAESALLNSDPLPYVRKIEGGKYLSLAQIEDDGEYLFIVFSMPRPGIARVISARAMTREEKAEFRRRRMGKQGR